MSHDKQIQIIHKLLGKHPLGELEVTIVKSIVAFTDSAVRHVLHERAKEELENWSVNPIKVFGEPPFDLEEFKELNKKHANITN